MSLGRFLSSCAAVAAVAGCAVVAVGMGRAGSQPSARTAASTPVPTPTPRPAYLPLNSAAPAAWPLRPAAATPATKPTRRPVASPAATTPAPPSTQSVVVAARPAAVAPAAPRPAASVAPAAPVRTAPQVVTRPVVPSRPVAAPRGRALPLGYSTGNATRVITVVARSTRSTTAVLQAWTKAAGGGWLPYGAAVTAHVGSDGLSTHPSESRSATPIGSFTLTQAFGHYGNPGTPLPYFHTTGADWWISHAGKYYNTHQRCTSTSCPSHPSVAAGDEHLYYETPFYNYAVVIDYNTRNAPGGVHAGAGSAFFLHVTDGNPTAGCVAIPQSRLLTLMRWLSPAAHPRILIGT